MSDEKRRGRPAKDAEPGTRAALGLRVTAATKAAIEARALITGRTQAQEAEWLIELALATEYARACATPPLFVAVQEAAARGSD